MQELKWRGSRGQLEEGRRPGVGRGGRKNEERGIRVRKRTLGEGNAQKGGTSL